jgi:S-methylmethionine-dependent homocysteine/selenocysteine methylase
MLTDGATGTRLRLETGLELDPVLDVASLAITGRSHVLRAVASEYASIAAALDLPIELDAMTYWASPDHLAAAGRASDLAAVNRACVEALLPVKDIADAYIAGVIGPRADGYRPVGAMDAHEAAEYHAPQAGALAAAGADLLLGSTMSTSSEALGVARAMAVTGTPYVMAAVLTADGTMPDGTSMADLVDEIDDAITEPPVHYLVSCTHPSTALAGMRSLGAAGRDVSDRVIGIKANGSALDVEQLDGAQRVHADAPLVWIGDLAILRSEFGFRVMGGCCGTDGRHILALGLHLSGDSPRASPASA